MQVHDVTLGYRRFKAGLTQLRLHVPGFGAAKAIGVLSTVIQQV